MRFVTFQSSQPMHPMLKVVVAVCGLAVLALLAIFGLFVFLGLVLFGTVGWLVRAWYQRHGPDPLTRNADKPGEPLEGEFRVIDASREQD